MAAVDSLARLQLPSNGAAAPAGLDRLLQTDMAAYLPDDLLVKVDITTMLHSLEGRSPFLDHHLAEFAARLPVHYKLRGRTGKYILRRALSSVLPSNILNRDKRGFAVPIDRWFRQELRTVIYQVLLDPRTLARGFFRPEAVQAMLDEHASGRVNHRYRLWTLLMLELWFRTYIDRAHNQLTGPAEGIL